MRHVVTTYFTNNIDNVAVYLHLAPFTLYPGQSLVWQIKRNVAKCESGLVYETISPALECLPCLTHNVKIEKAIKTSVMFVFHLNPNAVSTEAERWNKEF